MKTRFSIGDRVYVPLDRDIGVVDSIIRHSDGSVDYWVRWSNGLMTLFSSCELKSAF